jgi:hypothetical protein
MQAIDYDFKEPSRHTRVKRYQIHGNLFTISNVRAYVTLSTEELTFSGSRSKLVCIADLDTRHTCISVYLTSTSIMVRLG